MHESVSVQLRADGFNVLNHPTFNNPTTSLTSSSFGQVTQTYNQATSSSGSNARVLQFAATIQF
jgi:hypothetical protein